MQFRTQRTSQSSMNRCTPAAIRSKRCPAEHALQERSRRIHRRHPAPPPPNQGIARKLEQLPQTTPQPPPSSPPSRRKEPAPSPCIRAPAEPSPNTASPARTAARSNRARYLRQPRQLAALADAHRRADTVPRSVARDHQNPLARPRTRVVSRRSMRQVMLHDVKPLAANPQLRPSVPRAPRPYATDNHDRQTCL